MYGVSLLKLISLQEQRKESKIQVSTCKIGILEVSAIPISIASSELTPC